MYPYTRSRKNKKKARYKTKSHSHFSNPKVCMPRKRAVHTGVRFISFLSGGFTTIAVINPTEKKFAKRIYVKWAKNNMKIDKVFGPIVFLFEVLFLATLLV